MNRDLGVSDSCLDTHQRRDVKSPPVWSGDPSGVWTRRNGRVRNLSTRLAYLMVLPCGSGMVFPIPMQAQAPESSASAPSLPLTATPAPVRSAPPPPALNAQQEAGSGGEGRRGVGSIACKGGSWRCCFTLRRQSCFLRGDAGGQRQRNVVATHANGYILPPIGRP